MTALRASIRKLLQQAPDPVLILAETSFAGLTETLANWQAEASCWQGPLYDGGPDASVLVVGQSPFTAPWIARIFDQSPAQSPAGKLQTWPVLGGSSRLNVDLVLWDLNPLTAALAQRRGWYIAPKYVEVYVDLQADFDLIVRSRGTRDDLRYINKLDYSFQDLSGDRAFDEFYDTMLLPTVQKRHGALARTVARSETKQLWTDSWALGAFLDGEWVGGSIIPKDEDGTLRWGLVGWRNGDPAIQKKRVVSALVLEIVRRAKADGHKWLNMGSSNPFPDDGPLNYKLRYNGKIVEPSYQVVNRRTANMNARLGVHFDLDKPVAKEILKRCAFFDVSKGHLRTVCWNAKIPSLFRHQVDSGFPWTDLSQEEKCGTRRP